MFNVRKISLSINRKYQYHQLKSKFLSFGVQSVNFRKIDIGTC